MTTQEIEYKVNLALVLFIILVLCLLGIGVMYKMVKTSLKQQKTRTLEQFNKIKEYKTRNNEKKD